MRLVEIGQRAAAIDDAAAMLDDPVGVGADQRQVAAQPDLDALAIHVGRIVVVVEIGDDHRLGLLGRAADDAKALVERIVDLPAARRGG